MSESKENEGGLRGLIQNAPRRYVLVAAILLVVILVAAILLVTRGIPALRGDGRPTSVTEVELTPSAVPTFTPGPTKSPTDTPPPPPPNVPSFAMTDDYTVAFVHVSAGARPSTEWTGFFGQIQDASGKPLPGVPLIVLYPGFEPVELEGVSTSPIVLTDADGNYEIRLANAPLADTWTILVLAENGHPASEILTFQTDENTETGIQQIQVIWQRQQ